MPKWEMATRSCSARAVSYCCRCWSCSGSQAQAMLIVAVVERVEEIAEGWRTPRMMRRHSAAIVCNMIRLLLTGTSAAAAAARARSTTSITRRFYITRQFAVASISSFSTPPLRFSSPSSSSRPKLLLLAVAVLLSFRFPPLCPPYHWPGWWGTGSNSIN